MRMNRAAATAASLATVAALVLAGCSSSSKKTGTGPSSSGSGGSSTSSAGGGGSASGYDAASSAIVNPSTKQGGTLKLGATSDCDSWDPKIAYYGWCWNMQRLYIRSLIGYSVVNGTQFKLAPDLATDMGTHSADFKTWTFTLKPGIKWENGKPVTPMDIKYGVERNWAAAEIPGGPNTYFVNGGIAAPKNYKGPYKSGDLPNSAISTTANTITFHLASPNADFDYLMSMGMSAPVPYKTENGQFKGATYTKHPMSDGPFMFKSYSPGKSLVLVRNPFWSQATDTIHHPLVNEVDLTIDSNPVDLDDRLDAGTLDANAAGGAGGLTPAFKTKALTTPSIKAHVDDPAAASTQYASVFQTVITNIHCRRAIFYATNKASILNVYGGATSGTIAGGMTPPGIAGHEDNYDPYPVGPDGTGDLTKAKAELSMCGKPNGFSVNFAYATPSNYGPKVYAAYKAALARVNITLNAVTDDASTYYNTFIGSPSNVIKKQIGMAVAGWGADFPTPVGFYQAIANGASIVDPGTSNYVSLNDPIVNKLLDSGPAGKNTEADWQNLDHQIMNDAVYVPLYWSKTLYYRNPRMTNVTCDNALAFGIYDFVNVGVTS